VSSAWLSAAIQEFEQVTLDNGTELFRVRARARQGDDPEPRPVLVTRDHEGVVQIYEPLSSGGDRRGLIRLAYTAPTDRVGPSTVFSLRLPDGYSIELPEPTPGEHRSELDDGQAAGAEPPDSSQANEGAAERIAELERELGELRSSDGELRQRLAELTAEHEQAAAAAGQAEQALESLRGSHGAVEAELQSTRESAAQVLSELELARGERAAADEALEAARAEPDQALETIRGERDEAIETARDERSERARLTARLRQLQARIELIRADATGARPGTDPRLRQLESEREQLTTHVRALAELLSINGRAGDTGDAAELDGAVAPSAADRLETLRAHAVREANQQAERELRRLRAGTPL
jgi:predicted  nucleic acid-binding Zn-ribbon protein